ncbi:substrate-binding domain-containing protein [Nocardioides sp. CN2-186]|uniref:sugar ABC transporter substrate-binding protein n=1 Tax=Nocardioides tweenelious TaxID=3156607 RepID=UPI0032B38243
MVDSGVQNPTGTAIVTAAKQAAEALGWKFSVFDGKYEPQQYQEGIRQAIAQKADVIWVVSIDCPLVKTALEEAKSAGIPVVGQESADCSDVDPSSPSYFADNLNFSEGSFIDWAKALGASQAYYLLSKLGSKANVIEVSVAELVVTNAVHEGFAATMKKECPECKVTDLPIQLSDMGSALQERVQTALLRNPDANGLAVSYDDLMTLGVAGAVMASGRNDSLEVVAGSGYPANLQLIRDNGGQDAGYVIDLGYESWTAADMINRLLAGQKQGPSGVGLAVVDKDHGMPSSGTWKTNIDYQSAFKKVWGVS